MTPYRAIINLCEKKCRELYAADPAWHSTFRISQACADAMRDITDAEIEAVVPNDSVWLTIAHNLCTDAGIRRGHISQRLEDFGTYRTSLQNPDPVAAVVLEEVRELIVRLRTRAKISREIPRSEPDRIYDDCEKAAALLAKAYGVDHD